MRWKFHRSDEERVHDLHQLDLTYRQIADEVGLTHQEVTIIMRRYHAWMAGDRASPYSEEVTSHQPDENCYCPVGEEYEQRKREAREIFGRRPSRGDPSVSGMREYHRVRQGNNVFYETQ